MRASLTYANVASTLALFLAVSTGGAFAASTVITGKQIKNSSITGADVKNGSIGLNDLAETARVAGPAGATGATGPTGPAGATGAKGEAGPSGTADLDSPGSKIAHGTLTGLPFGTVPAQTCKAIDTTSLGLPSGSDGYADDVITVSPTSALLAGITLTAAPKGLNQITVTACNVTAAAIAVGSASVNYIAIDAV